MDAFIDVLVDRVEVTRGFWSAVAGRPAGEGWVGHPEFASFLPPGATSYLHVQASADPARVHLDIPGDPDQDLARLEELGARRDRRRVRWQAIASPAGLPLCVYRAYGWCDRPAAVAWCDGHRSRLVQLCVDVPAQLYDDEPVF